MTFGDRAVAVLEQIRDLLAHRGRQDKEYGPTATGGVETPLVMANVSIVTNRSLVGVGPAFAGVGDTPDIHHYTQGEIIISVSARKPPAIFFYSAEVQVIGSVSNQRSILATAVVIDGVPLVVPIPLGQDYDRISIAARQLVNGLPSDASFDNNAAMAGASLELQATGRFAR